MKNRGTPTTLVDRLGPALEHGPTREVSDTQSLHHAHTNHHSIGFARALTSRALATRSSTPFTNSSLSSRVVGTPRVVFCKTTAARPRSAHMRILRLAGPIAGYSGESCRRRDCRSRRHRRRRRLPMLPRSPPWRLFRHCSPPSLLRRPPVSVAHAHTRTGAHSAQRTGTGHARSLRARWRCTHLAGRDVDAQRGLHSVASPAATLPALGPAVIGVTVGVALEAEEELNDPDEAAREAGADGEDVAKGDRVCARTDVIEGVQHAVRHGRTQGSVPTRGSLKRFAGALFPLCRKILPSVPEFQVIELVPTKM